MPTDDFLLLLLLLLLLSIGMTTQAAIMSFLHYTGAGSWKGQTLQKTDVSWGHELVRDIYGRLRPSASQAAKE